MQRRLYIISKYYIYISFRVLGAAALSFWLPIGIEISITSSAPRQRHHHQQPLKKAHLRNIRIHLVSMFYIAAVAVLAADKPFVI